MSTNEVNQEKSLSDLVADQFERWQSSVPLDVYNKVKDAYESFTKHLDSTHAEQVKRLESELADLTTKLAEHKLAIESIEMLAFPMADRKATPQEIGEAVGRTYKLSFDLHRENEQLTKQLAAAEERAKGVVPLNECHPKHLGRDVVKVIDKLAVANGGSYMGQRYVVMTMDNVQPNTIEVFDLTGVAIRTNKLPTPEPDVGEKVEVQPSKKKPDPAIAELAALSASHESRLSRLEAQIGGK